MKLKLGSLLGFCGHSKAFEKFDVVSNAKPYEVERAGYYHCACEPRERVLYPLVYSVLVVVRASMERNNLRTLLHV